MAFECITLTRTNLAERIAKQLDHTLHEATFQQFADGELNVTLKNPELFHRKTVLIIQSTGHPVNEHVLGLSFLAQELKNAGAQRIIAIIPYFGYARQERSVIPGKPGHAALVAQLFEGAGIDELFSVELHDTRIMKLFTIPVHNISIAPLIAQHINELIKHNRTTCLVAPDKGAADYVDFIARQVGLGTLTFSKERFGADQTRVTGLDGSCHGTNGIIIDDIIATGGTAINVCNALPERGFKDIYGYFAHPVLAGPALERIASSAFKTVFVANTLPLSDIAQASPKIKIFDVSNVIVSAVKRSLGIQTVDSSASMPDTTLRYALKSEKHLTD
jgi:ribose-phosphate pyrophosphokinase